MCVLHFDSFDFLLSYLRTFVVCMYNNCSFTLPVYGAYCYCPLLPTFVVPSQIGLDPAWDRARDPFGAPLWFCDLGQEAADVLVCFFLMLVVRTIHKDSALLRSYQFADNLTLLCYIGVARYNVIQVLDFSLVDVVCNGFAYLFFLCMC